MRILLVEDEEPLRVAVTDSLHEKGYRVLVAADGEIGLKMALEEKPDIIVLDIMLPKRNGFEVCEAIRKQGLTMPVIMLTAKGLIDDRVRGLDAGADDYVVKPFSLEELHARLRALSRRVELAQEKLETVCFGEVEVDFERRRCRRKGKEVDLTAKEFGSLELMVSRNGDPVSRDDFLDLVWGYAAFPTTRTVDNHIARLRSKLEVDPSHPKHFLTVPKIGYRFKT